MAEMRSCGEMGLEAEIQPAIRMRHDERARTGLCKAIRFIRFEIHRLGGIEPDRHAWQAAQRHEVQRLLCEAHDDMEGIVVAREEGLFRKPRQSDGIEEAGVIVAVGKVPFPIVAILAGTR